MSDVISITSSLRNVEAELSVIGALLTNPSVRRRALSELTPDMFSEEFLGNVLREIGERRDRGASLAVEIAQLHDENGREVIANAISAASPACDVMDYVREIQAYYQRRRLVLASAAAIDAAADKTERVERVIADAQADIAAIQSHAAADFVDGGEAADGVLSRIEAIRSGGHGQYLPSGLPSLDRMCGGLEMGETIILAGRPGMGKTSVALWFALRQAQAGRGVAIFSLEMTATACASRMMSCLIHEANHSYSALHVPYQHMMDGRLSNEALEQVRKAREALAALPVSIDDRGALWMDDIEASTARWKAKCISNDVMPALVVIDHIGLVSGNRWQSQNEKIAEISRRCKQMAKEHQVCVIGVSQLNRAVESRADKRPMLSDLRDSGALEQDAAQVIFPFREAYYLAQEAEHDESKMAEAMEKKNLLEVIVAKNRNGPTGQVNAFADIANCFFGEMEDVR